MENDKKEIDEKHSWSHLVLNPEIRKIFLVDKFEKIEKMNLINKSKKNLTTIKMLKEWKEKMDEVEKIIEICQKDVEKQKEYVEKFEELGPEITYFDGHLKYLKNHIPTDFVLKKLLNQSGNNFKDGNNKPLNIHKNSLKKSKLIEILTKNDQNLEKKSKIIDNSNSGNSNENFENNDMNFIKRLKISKSAKNARIEKIAKSPNNKIDKIFIKPVSEEEFLTIPKFLNTNLTLSTLNKAAEEATLVLKRKYSIIFNVKLPQNPENNFPFEKNLPFDASIKLSRLKRSYEAQENNSTKNEFFFMESDLKNTSLLKPNTTGKRILGALKFLRRIKNLAGSSPRYALIL